MNLDPKHAEALAAMEAALKHEVSVNLSPTPITALIASARAAAERALTPKRWSVEEEPDENPEYHYFGVRDGMSDDGYVAAVFYVSMPGGPSAARAEAERLCAEWNAKEERS